MTANRILDKTLTWAIRWTVRAAIASILPFVTLGGNAWAQHSGELQTVQGRVQSLSTAPMGEVDGAVLDDGTMVHWPPHLADRFSAVAVTGDRINVVGRMETGPEGDTHFEAAKVTNLRTSASAESELGPPPPAPARPGGPPRPGSLTQRNVLAPRTNQARTAEGRVMSFTTAPMGEVDGAVLDDGTVVHWPPHLADRFSAVVTRGDRIKVNGFNETGPAGDTHFEVQTAVNLGTKRSATADGGPPEGRLESDRSGDFAPSSAATAEVERRLKVLEDQIAQLREEIRRLRDEL
jgi:hypothetical protein